MPIVSSNYQPPFYFKNGHLATVLPSMFRTVEGVEYERERITTPDHDFLDLDRIYRGSKSVVVIFHGLEGSSERHYVKGIAKQFARHDWDVVAVNSRSCSGEMNLASRLYHHADTEDVRFVLDYFGYVQENVFGRL